MLAQWCEFSGGVVVNVMCDSQGFRADIHHVKGILISFPTDSAAGRAGAALDDNDAAITMVAGKKIERVSDVGPMQVSAEYHFDIVFDKAINRAPAFLHADIDHFVVTGREVVMRYDDASFIFRNLLQRLLHV